MAGIRDLTIINSNTCAAARVESGTVKTLCSPDLCGSTNLTVYRRTIDPGRFVETQAANDYHLIYVIHAPIKGLIDFKGERYEAEDGAGVLLAPWESVRFEATGSPLDLLHMVTPKPPATVDE